MGLDPRRERSVRRSWVLAIVVLQMVNIVYFLRDWPPDWSVALPLHVCDLMGWVAAIALMQDRRLPRSCVVFIGLVLCSNAFATPTVTMGPSTLRFWLFWGTHLQIIGSGFYELVVRGYRPRARDAANVFGVLVLYAAVMVPLNLATGWNYGYVGPGKPGTPTIVDVLGSWPGRLVVMAVIVSGAFGAFTWLVGRIARWFDPPNAGGGSTLLPKP